MTTTAIAPAAAPAACPSWCELADHDDTDGGQGYHSAHRTIELSLYPFTAHGKLWHETLIIGLGIDPHAGPRIAGPHITIVPRDENLASVMHLTLDEAEDAAAALTKLIALARRARRRAQGPARD